MRIQKFVIGLTLLSASLNVYSGEINAAKINGIYCALYGGKNICSVYFNKLSANSGCGESNNYKYRMQFKGDTNIGKSILTIALSAYKNGNLVYARGSGKCTIHAETEDLDMLFIPPKCSESNKAYACIID